MANCPNCTYNTDGRTYYPTDEANLTNHLMGHLVEELRLLREANTPFWVVKSKNEVKLVTPEPGSILPLSPDQHIEGPYYGYRKPPSPQDAPDAPADPPPPPTTRPVVDSAPDPESRAKPSVSKPKAGAP